MTKAELEAEVVRLTRIVRAYKATATKVKNKTNNNVRRTR